MDGSFYDRVFGINPYGASGSYHLGGEGGGLWFVMNRWHACCREGMWLLTMTVRSAAPSWCAPNGNYNAVMDDFGNLVVVP